MQQPAVFDDPERIADAIIEQVGPRIVLGLPLGLGKANHIANALYERVAGDSSLSLTILTALTLEAPQPGGFLQRRFLEPLSRRLYADYPELDYARARREQNLPDNIRVEEFFFLAGSQMGNPQAQQTHICANYTHAMGYLLDRGVNVIAQLLARQGGSLSLSCNTDLSLDLLERRGQNRARFLFVGQVNPELPYMGGGARIDDTEVDLLLDAPDLAFPPFPAPREPIAPTEYAAALHAAALIPDGGTLQIGIGAIGDAVAQALILRHHHNPVFRDRLTALGGEAAGEDSAHLDPFREGLHGVSEMMVEAFLDLEQAGVLRREVDGKLLEAAFFLGSRAFYRRLRELPPELRDKLTMTSVQHVNELYGDETAKRQQRVGARFVNKAMMATLLGDVISDGLEDGQVISGVGGQYNFVAQAFALEDARSVILLPATRETGGRVQSNIRWSYGHVTLPRHLRDIVVTEYGVADLRGKTDADVIAAMLCICDSRFQEELRQQAQRAGKLPEDFELPERHRQNYPDRLAGVLGHPSLEGLLPAFPFGSDFTPEEETLLPALKLLRNASGSKRRLAALMWRGLRCRAISEPRQAALNRLALNDELDWRERLYRWLVLGALEAAESSRASE